MSATKRILVVEDEMIIALDMESTLTDLGHEVVIATTTAEAILHSGDIDLAIVDYHLKDGKTDEVAMELRRKGVPFIVCSGSAGLQELGEVFDDMTFLPKPFTTDGLIGALSDVTSRGGDSANWTH